LRSLSIVQTFLLEVGSSPEVGSSKNSIYGSPTKDIARFSFLLLPPESVLATLRLSLSI